GDKNRPWRSGGNKGPTDLDAVVRDLQRKLANLLRGGRGNGNGNGARGEPIVLSGALLGVAAAALLGIWGLTGIYVVDAAERGVVLRFGAYQTTTLPGLRWHLPWPIERAEKINIGETVGWSYHGSMLTRDENIVNVNLEVQFRR